MYRLLLNLSDEINLYGVIYMLLHQILVYIIHGKTQKNTCKNNKFKISARTWNEKIELLGGSNFISDIKDYSNYIIKKHEAVTDNPQNNNKCKWKIK